MYSYLRWLMDVTLDVVQGHFLACSLQVQDYRVEGKPPNRGLITIGNTCNRSRLKVVGTASPRGHFPGGGDFTCCDHLALKLLSLPQQKLALLSYFKRTSRQMMGCLLEVSSLLLSNMCTRIITSTVTAPVLLIQRMRHISTPILVKWKKGQSITVVDCIEDANPA